MMDDFDIYIYIYLHIYIHILYVYIYMYMLIDWSWCFCNFEICRYHQFDIFWSYVDVLIDCLHSDPFVWSILCGKYSMQHGKDVKCWQGCLRCVFSCEGGATLSLPFVSKNCSLLTKHEACLVFSWSCSSLEEQKPPKSDLHPKMSKTMTTMVCLKLGYPLVN